MYIEFYDGSATLLPIALHLLISHPLPYVEASGPVSPLKTYDYAEEEWRAAGKAYYDHERVSSLKHIAKYLFNNSSRVQWPHKLKVPRKAFSLVRFDQLKTIPTSKQAPNDNESLLTGMSPPIYTMIASILVAVKMMGPAICNERE
ncbi:hypothetical protein N0V91_005150 [Didymella pomorum]|uniref:Uncharacterized protein n=1 Tax=Didymella pomorum TaxID=749634 RepID=A0A9W8ZEN9_9PLEO|nr:hypothetical protein N0V91_005150 [Didymella pomorum]